MIGGVTAAPAEQAAARRNERELDRFLFGREGSASDRVGINPAEGRPLSSPHAELTSVIDKTMVWIEACIFTAQHAINKPGEALVAIPVIRLSD